MNKVIGFTALFITSLLFSTYGIFSRILAEQLTVFQQLYLRYSIGAIIVLAIVYLARKKSFDFKKFLDKKIILFSCLIPISFYFFIKSFVESKLSISISGFYAGTIFSSLLIGFLFLKEKFTKLGLSGLILIVLSFIFLNNLDIQAIVNIGLIWGLISGVAYGIANFIKKDATNFSKEEMLFVISTSTAILMLILSLINKEAMPNQLGLPTLGTLLIFVLFALSAEYLTLLGFRNFDLYIGSIILSLEIIFTVFVGIFFFKEIPTRAELIGVTLIIISVILTNLPINKKNS